MKTLLLNPPSFENFDGGASSRWPATREIRSFWYPVWLTYPAGMIPNSKVVDAPPHDITVEQTIQMSRDFDFVVLFTSTPGFASDVRLAQMMKDATPSLKIAFVGPHVTARPEQSRFRMPMRATWSASTAAFPASRDPAPTWRASPPACGAVPK